MTRSQGAPLPGSILHRAARIEDAANRAIRRRLSSRGWVPTITGYTGYGAAGWVRVVGRVLLSRPDPRTDRRTELVRGWRSFTTVPVADVEVVVTAGSHRHVLRTDRGGYLDADLEADLPAGWGQVHLETAGGVSVSAPVRVVDPDVDLGIVSDIDDTVMVTSLPRPMLAAWNTFVLNEHARRSVPGMAVLYERLVNAYPGAPVVYLSTGAWNVAPTLTRFLGRHLYPAGPILLTDWGPTKNGWFRSGQEHKRKSLERLAREFPHMRWLLVGDDGQHDPELYSGFARTHPQNVAGVAIRHLSPTEQVLASGLPVPMEQAEAVPDVPWVSGLDGAALAERLRGAGIL